MKTIKEAAEYYAHNNFVMQETNHYKALLQGFEAGAKWQSEIMYSDLDMTNYALYILHNNVISPEEWFLQFKKK